jgi:hypothetical protein
MYKNKANGLTIAPHLNDLYRNRRREAMTDEELLPEIRLHVERLFADLETPEFQAVLLLPDLSVKGFSSMLTIGTVVFGDNLQLRDAEHLDPKYLGIANRKCLEMLRAKRAVRVTECWASSRDDSTTYLPPHLDPGHKDIIMATFQHKGQVTDCLTISWEISTAADGTRRLGVPTIGEKTNITNPDLVL